MSIIEFLEARIAEDEQVARGADSGRWLGEDKGISFEWYADDFHDGEAQARLTADTKANMHHIARHDPARVLAECAAKRAIIAQQDAALDTYAGARVLDHVLQAVASVYKDHPDYRQEWAL